MKGLIKSKNYYFILSASFLIEFARSMYYIVLTWLLYELTGDPLYTGLLVGFGFLPGLFLNLFSGVLVDNLDRKKLAIGANLIVTLVLIILLNIFLGNLILPWMMIVVHMIVQVSNSIYRPSLQSFVMESFNKDLLPKVFSESGAAGDTGGLVGSTLGGLIVALFPSIVSLIVIIFCYIIGTLSLFLIKRDDTFYKKIKRKFTFGKDIVDGFNYLKLHKNLLGLFCIMFVGQLVIHNSVAFLSVYTKSFLNQSVVIYGLLDAIISIGGIVSGIFGTWWWNKSGKFVASRSLIIIAIGLLLMGLSPFWQISAIGVFLIGLGTTWVRVLLQSVQQMSVEVEYSGRMSSYRMICNQTAVAVGGPLLGLIATKYGVNFSYISLLIPVCLVLIYSYFQAKESWFINLTSKSVSHS
ncbi:MFS transporter [Paenibacillus sp. MZ04-78.2]|uniref:MFS transporter n=1 Tax=Paenibacillus sp. MZ04-78.2 TaxID=2962034 RepID=UPI0020B823A2|nr:MFS transporter [Paenibacillus sp. MZ04-78.2]MCP3776513.1 MFS transporter [Paenibacillus sp. MZ04-78.2]